MSTKKPKRVPQAVTIQIEDEDDPFGLLGSEKKRQRSHSNKKKEIFKVIDGIKTENRFVEVDNEETKQSQMMQERQRRHEQEEKKVMFKDRRSSRKASNSSRRASNQIFKTQTSILDCNVVNNAYNEAEEKIASAA